MRAVSRLQKITWRALAKVLLFYISITTNGCFYHELKICSPFQWKGNNKKSNLIVKMARDKDKKHLNQSSSLLASLLNKAICSRFKMNFQQQEISTHGWKKMNLSWQYLLTFLAFKRSSNTSLRVLSSDL